MTTTTTTSPRRGATDPATTRRPVAPTWFGVGLLVLGAALALNTVLGPLIADVITYPFTDTVRNETLGLEAVSLLLVAPLCVVAGVMALRGHRAGPVLALGPTAYTVYMFAQYVAGPGYPTYARSLLLHLAVFVLAGALLITAWSASIPAVASVWSDRALRRWSWALFGLAAFVVSRWVPAFAAMGEQGPLAEAYVADAGMYWSIFLLDLGIVVPALVATAVGLRRDRTWAPTSLFALVGWFFLVPPSVTAMAVTKIVNDDPYADPADTVVLGVGAVVFAVVAFVLYRPLLRGVRGPAADPGTGRRGGTSNPVWPSAMIRGSIATDADRRRGGTDDTEDAPAWSPSDRGRTGRGAGPRGVYVGWRRRCRPHRHLGPRTRHGARRRRPHGHGRGDRRWHRRR